MRSFRSLTGLLMAAGCVALDDDTLVKIMQWLRPGAVIAVTKQA